ncbi:MAG: histidine kinase dimerization/phospho-acceptor domain-containing protein, partial [Pseudohongiellaceae bacterium]
MTRSKDQDSVALTPHSVISEHRQEILVRWLDAAQEGIPYAQNQSRAELADHLQEQFQVIIEALASQAGYVSRQDRENAPSALHGRERATINNWNVVKLVQEYVILRRVIVGYCRDSCPLDEPEISTITSVIEDAMLIAVTEFTRSLQRVQQKLMGTLIHDVRTPLGVANLYVDLLDMEDIEEDHRRQYNDIVKRNLARCLAMLEDLLDVAQVEAGQGLLMHFKGTDLNSAMRTVCEEEDQIYTQRI